MAKGKKINGFLAFILVVVFSLIGAAAGFFGNALCFEFNNVEGDVYYAGGLSIHFPELGNYKTGDCTLIKKGSTEILIDAGATVDNIDTLDAYIKNYCTDGILEYVVVTHAHEDHYAGFSTENSLFNRYKIGTIIEFSQITENKAEQKMYKNYIRERNEAVAAGAVCYTAKECRESGNYVFNISKDVTFTVLDSKFYYEASTTENNHSVCTLLSQGENNFLFTGDLEKKGEEELVKRNDLPEVELYKAGHHGSKTSSHNEMLKMIKPKRVCVCCCAGTSEYTTAKENQFPTQEFVDRIAPYTKYVYVTSMVDDDAAKTYKSMNGNIVVSVKKKGIEVECSNNNTVLKDTEWFKENRTCPDAWKAA